eukprot:scaffold89132_cov41-Prasinocladus_malaysianus.AAC.1
MALELHKLLLVVQDCLPVVRPTVASGAANLGLLIAATGQPARLCVSGMAGLRALTESLLWTEEFVLLDCKTAPPLSRNTCADLRQAPGTAMGGVLLLECLFTCGGSIARHLQISSQILSL